MAEHTIAWYSTVAQLVPLLFFALVFQIRQFDRAPFWRMLGYLAAQLFLFIEVLALLALRAGETDEWLETMISYGLLVGLVAVAWPTAMAFKKDTRSASPAALRGQMLAALITIVVLGFIIWSANRSLG